MTRRSRPDGERGRCDGPGQGRVKQAAGDLADDQDLKNEGKLDDAAGKAKQKLGDAEDAIEDGIDRLEDKIRGDQ